MVEILQGTQPYLAVRLLRFGEEVTQQDGENIESIVLGTRLQTMDERNEGGSAASVRESGHGADFDGVRETRQSGDATGWYRRGREHNFQSAHSFDTE